MLGFTPAGFSGYCIYPNSVFAADLDIGFSQALTQFSILYAPEEYATDSSATMRVTAYMDGTFIGTSTTTASQPGTWPTATLSFSSLSAFNSVVVHYESPPPTGGDYGPIFMADNMYVTVAPVPCFCRGTLILTASGEVPIERLAVGNRVVTLSGLLTPIKWLGRRSYDPRFVTGNRQVLPIRIAADALGTGVPMRDLWVSPDHALYLDGMLVPARLLVNGTTIIQAQRVERLEYFHIELPRHDIPLAEGAPAESYIECYNRGLFHNAAEFTRLYPDENGSPGRFCAPRLASDVGRLPQQQGETLTAA